MLVLVLTCVIYLSIRWSVLCLCFVLIEKHLHRKLAVAVIFSLHTLCHIRILQFDSVTGICICILQTDFSLSSIG